MTCPCHSLLSGREGSLSLALPRHVRNLLKSQHDCNKVNTNFFNANLCFQAEAEVFLWRYLAMFATYGVAFVVYCKRLPESLRPGSFDIWWSSHTLWHLLLIVAMWCQTDAIESFLARGPSWDGFRCDDMGAAGLHTPRYGS